MKWEAVEHLDLYLTQFEEQITKRGAKVFWAEDSEQALDFIGAICKKKNVKPWSKARVWLQRRFT